MNKGTFNVLFLCTHNSARSIMAEAIINNLAVNKGRFRAFSAGSHPAQQINRFALEQIRTAGLPAFGLSSKGWEEFAAPDSPRMDFVFTVCDTLAGEVCPVWPGNPISAHWGLADPAAINGDDAQKRRAFSQTFIYLYNRINIFTSLRIEKLDRLGLQRKLDEIGET
jgi:arsenate reductase (thioredoxin)